VCAAFPLGNEHLSSVCAAACSKRVSVEADAAAAAATAVEASVACTNTVSELKSEGSKLGMFSLQYDAAFIQEHSPISSVPGLEISMACDYRNAEQPPGFQASKGWHVA
jgi:hypothetical protein